MKKVVLLSLLAFIAVAAFIFTPYTIQSKKNLARPTEKINVALKWLHQAQFAGNYVAVEKGFYRDEALDVNLLPFVIKGQSSIDLVVSGKAQYGITGADELILARAKGVPVRAIAVIYKTNPVTAYSLKKSGITKPQDFIGKTVGIQMGQNVEYLYLAMMKKLNIDRSKIKEIPIGHDATELLNGTSDVSTGYIINEPHMVLEAGQKVNTILASDYGVNMYADIVITSEETIASKPEQVLSFLKATLKGWQYAIENIDEAVDITLKYAPKSSASHEKYMLESSVPLILTGRLPIGMMEKEKWEQAQKILLEQNILDKPIQIKDIYDLQFLEAIYLK